jgi:uncharacterized protein (TIGR02611 family)
MPQTTQAATFEDNRVADGGSGATRCPDCTDGLGKPKPIEPGTFRARMHANRGTALCWRTAVFVAGLVCVAVGIALTVLPGPLTIPPVVLGLWIWSTEFSWARAIFQTAKRKAQEAWAHAKQHPVSSAAITIGGLVVAGVVVWAVGRFQLVDKATAALGF